MFRTIWERYFLKEFIKVFFLFLICFYGFYVLVDYASHTSALPHHQVQILWKDLARYYLFVFASRAEILIPLALLIAFIKTVCQLNAHQELVALLAGGIKLKTLMRPFLFVGLVCTILLFLNEQFLLPDALKKLRRIEDATKSQKHRHVPAMAVQHVILEDGSLLLFQNYDTAKEQFFDAYWIQSIDNLYRIKYLSPYTAPPIGYFVDHFIRQPSGELLQQHAYQTLDFPDMRFNPEILQSTILDPDVLSIKELIDQFPNLSPDANEKESKMLTSFYWKLILPWLCILAIIAPAPSCVRFSRQLPIFFIYVCCLFGLIAFYMFMDAAQVIAKRQVLPPLIAIGFPFLTVFGFFGWRFAKMH
ncbi:LptF/LptG family permease [Candidatus Protochlamydia phocaeensis]|uniref:LptF/LptG family permease n=1 Tax=Candidatus Protochlamydia phocaeensis TaxID=1414722 RepID=UPI0008390260|nr:LptF/LptG family permease [Candidatus Protochlamydia phocaeensis]